MDLHINVEAVETFLIAHPKFLDDFVKLFVTLQRLEDWITQKKLSVQDITENSAQHRESKSNKSVSEEINTFYGPSDHCITNERKSGSSDSDNEVSGDITESKDNELSNIKTSTNSDNDKNGECSFSTENKMLVEEDKDIVHNTINPKGDTKDKAIGHLQCSYCMKYFEKWKNLKEHVRIHTNECPYNCKYCGAKFRWRSGYRRHVINSHPFLWEERMAMTLSQKRATFSNAKSENSIEDAHNRFQESDTSSSNNNDGIENISELEGEGKEKKGPLSSFNGTARVKGDGENLDTPEDIETLSESEDETVVTDSSENSLMFSCGICSQVFKSAPVLRDHFKVHSTEKPFKCSFCARLISSVSKFSRHLRSHKGIRLFECETCRKRFTDEAALKGHSRIHCNIFPYQCNLCFKEFRWKGGFFSHIKSRHKDDVSRNSLQSYNSRSLQKLGAEIKKTETNQGNGHGGSHDETLEGQNHISQERMIPSGLETVYAVSVDDLGRRPEKEGATEYCCDICSKVFPGLAELVVHLQIHNSEKPFNCQQCSMSFSFTAELTQHLRFCREAKLFQCEICQSTFSAKNNLKEHFRIHTNEFPYRCKFCEKLFRWRGGLYTHVEKCHKDLCKGRKISAYEMRNTSVSFQRKSATQKRKEALSSKLDLKATFVEGAENSISGRTEIYEAKRYKCATCSSMFTGKSHLKEHQRIHTMENPYRCKFCQKEFRWRSGLYTHVRRVHKEETEGIKISATDMRNVAKSSVEVVAFELLAGVRQFDASMEQNEDVSTTEGRNLDIPVDFVEKTISEDVSEKGTHLLNRSELLQAKIHGTEPDNVFETIQTKYQHVEKFNQSENGAERNCTAVGASEELNLEHQREVELLSSGSLLYFEVTTNVDKSAPECTNDDMEKKGIVTASVHHEEVIDAGE